MSIKQRDFTKYPNPSDEPMVEKFARLGLRLKEPDEDVISWGQNAFQKPETSSSAEPVSNGTKPHLDYSQIAELSKQGHEEWLKKPVHPSLASRPTEAATPQESPQT